MAPGASKLQKEIKQSTPFGSAHAEGALSILRTADHIRRATAAVLAPSGLSPEQYNVLRILRGAGPDGLPTLEVGERTVERSPGITRLIDKLEAKKLVRRKRSRDDRRRVFCFITPAGLALLEPLDAPVEQATAGCLSALGNSETRVLIRMLERIRES